jgi:hypothetical protein
MLNLSGTLKEEGSFAESEKAGREALDAAHKALRPDNPLIPMLMYNIAATLEKQGRLAESERLLRKTMEIWRETRLSKSLHGDSRFEVILTEARRRRAAQRP